ncbi:hypothetical protein PVOR_07270 [Paenibacillus vortex V453]|jgi:hypothetical protein|uniref:Uncharacterized protein n=1 Tax=Paenibacillus vortex V453 TaxID=715225 RepID=A0A2R9SZ80_9BACL|nr:MULTISPECIES: hypothetical protein [Paenibacillus]ANA81027.1 hypothetical protein A3958_14060 [Paenibacillus glucanolyticus]AVV54853.1 hypothetical protein C7121_01155 [Paenibacillus glucanolyticus]EFU42637.1 hypothetical protein PVOR_07270 [Paenibacillus vortex V453]ETT36408.1 queuine tRNA-ribosyltransferase [Paenibacillus sp. FSL R5-808]MDH6674141.1 hypothetical protein [Paenibacillus sp. LBL]
MVFTFENVSNLTRKNNDVYFAVMPLGAIKDWGFPIIQSDVIGEDVILVNYDAVVSLINNKLQVTNPRFTYKLPSGSISDEYVVLIVSEAQYFPSYCMHQLMSFERFERLIEKGEKISSNSTKLMTTRSLHDIFKDFQRYRVERSLCPRLAKDLIKYVDSIMNDYPVLGYLPVAQRKQFRKKSIADSAIAWYCYIRYFMEQWTEDSQLTNLPLPLLSKEFHYENWKGQFFDRDNPVLFVNKGSYKFNDAQRDLIYEIWRQWIKEA